MAFYSDFAGHYDRIFPFRQGTFDFLDRWLPPEGRILDIGCGTGGYCAALDRTGRRCLGIDLDPGMIAEAERRHPDGRFQILGMDEIGLLSRSTYAGIICIGNVLPHLQAEHLAPFLLNIRDLLVPGGVWIFQTVNFDPILRSGERFHRFPVLRIEEGDLAFHRWYEDVEQDSLIFHTQLTAADKVVFQGEVELAPRISLEYLMGHEAAGFGRLGHFADYRESDFDPTVHSGSIFVWRRG
ncbi:class I SAM-dependent methyltransferase [bacterium]|nr:class I SAM-dependent methyltransferase [bacterium]